ncbi:MAG: hypothetical protein HN564_07875 [Flavobacteriales bacterium]|jgi:hypothetical protein|nr:hypothetical protein [Flavobacteriales bacterium]
MNSIIKRLYKNVCDVINDKEMKIKLDSIFLTFIDKKQNELIKILEPSCISTDSLTNNQLDSINKDHIYEFPNKQISISAFGIYEYEKEEKDIDDLKLVKFFDKKWKEKVPSLPSETKLSSKEILVITAMLCSRAFSLDQCINTSKKDSRIVDEWYNLFKEVHTFLLENNFINKPFDGIKSPMKGNEKLVRQMMRTIDKLPQKTNMIAVTQSKKRYHYYLNIVNSDRNVNTENLKSIIKLITNDNAELINVLPKFCDDIYSKYFSKIYENTLFNQGYRNIIVEASKDLLLS